MPTRMHTVVVFGDSLSDIGRKWTTKSGRMARLVSQMYVSPTGRFSDCRNWTDFMYEEASGHSLITGNADTSEKQSKRHLSFNGNSMVHLLGHHSFFYANYAEGGACGDVPREKSAFLGTFKDQVDEFETDCAIAPGLGNVLFIIWFGANDLYTANRPASEMGAVASQIARTQRDRLNLIVQKKSLATDPRFICKFIFVDLARPLTSVRYSHRLEEARRQLRTRVHGMAAPVAFNYQAWKEAYARNPLGAPLQRPYTRLLGNARSSYEVAMTRLPNKELRALVEQFEAIKNLEDGVLLFNATLARIARSNGDRVVEIGSCVTEQSIQALVSGNYRLKAGAAPQEAKFVTAQAYDQSKTAGHITTIDQVHPTDQMYRLIWKEIYKEIKRADCTFGNLNGVISGPTLSALAGPTPETKAAFDMMLRVSGIARTPPIDIPRY
jgi:lysophospholipase L1-like esterase